MRIYFNNDFIKGVCEGFEKSNALEAFCLKQRICAECPLCFSPLILYKFKKFKEYEIKDGIVLILKDEDQI